MSASTKKTLTIVTTSLVFALALAANTALACTNGEGEHECPFHQAGVEVKAQNLGNGASLTFTADDSETVRKLQEFAQRRAEGKGCDHEGEGHSEGHGSHQCPSHMEGVKVGVQNLRNGASLTFTADDSEVVRKLQEFAQQRAEGKGCDHGGEGHSEGKGHSGCKGH